MDSRLDIIVFGASGFTGTYCIESLHKLSKTNGHNFTWGIAGRSEEKLKDALQECGSNIGEDLSSVPTIPADVNDFESLRRMTARSRVIINCCGPFQLYGEPIIKACIATGTHQVDITGEPLYIETIEQKYYKAAEETGIYIVSACGFDSIPADLGVLLLQENFGGTVNSIETYFENVVEGRGAGINYGTYASVIGAIGDQKKLDQLRNKLWSTPSPKFRPRLEPRSFIHKAKLLNKWAIPFPGPDRSVIQRTQDYLFQHKEVRPVQVQTYFSLPSLLALAVFLIWGLIFSFIARYKLGRSLLLKYPSVFTGGIVKNEHPLKSVLMTGKFVMTFRAEGWNEKLSHIADEFTPPNKEMVIRLSAFNPGYTFTANVATLAAIVILSEREKLPKNGGVYTPGIAFHKTSLMKLAQENGLKLEIF